MKFKELYYVLDVEMIIKVYDTDCADEDNSGLVYYEQAYYLEGSFTWMEICNKVVCHINVSIYDDKPVMKIYVMTKRR